MKTLSQLLLVATLATGCKLEGDDGVKNACQSQTDCLDGFYCLSGTCMKNSTTTPDGPSGDFYGTVEAMTPASTGVSAENYNTLVAVSTAAGTLGCAVVGDLESSPGVDVAVAYAQVHADSGDTRCPTGVFAIVNDPSACTSSWPGELRPGCAIYKRWDATGKQVAYQLAIGGYVSSEQTVIGSSSYHCSGELSLRFSGGAMIVKSFQFDYNPLGSASAFCMH